MIDIIIFITQSIVIYILFFSILSAFLKIMSLEYFLSVVHDLTHFKYKDTYIIIASSIFLSLELIFPILVFIKNDMYGFFIISIISIYLIASFIILPSIIKGSTKNCGCYGKFFKTKVSWKKLVENSIYISFLIISLNLSIPHISKEMYVCGLFLLIIRIYFLRKGN
ncbi:MauE/DoxX family redox-associated membrane protein [Staphylococcus agnetis]|uniref:Methylamine utilisation protein MauE domain-containing protein n=1 Tax=Staphylococcus agnetis TaxID=985762 RepID=A0ABX3Z0G4_9STAP|nr:hypothetical protein B9M87_12380 [Staphylococcus agnetis]OSP22702.1 hypothetical protein B9L42_00015 [Staphylococcus agnetis]OTW29954.1 hypothetical protein B9M88_12520 [Staphylococcus agnetis]